MKKLALLAFAFGMLGVLGAVQAADKNDPTGTWKWTTGGKGGKGKAREQTGKFTVKGDKVTGTVSGGKNDTEISEGTFKDGKISFTVTREFNGNKFVSKYSGTVKGDAIKGTIERTFNDKDTKSDWNAKREKTTKD
ncbi:MAG TPA: hypothetical protein VGI99_11560 [Gemmataceae bacterium]